MQKQRAFAQHLWDKNIVPRNSAAYNQALSIGHNPNSVTEALSEFGDQPSTSWIRQHLQDLQANPWTYGRS
jgi:hypothetical protein